MACLEVLLVLVAVGYLLYKWSIKDFDIFEKRGVPYEKPLPLVGNSLPIILKKSGFIKEIRRFYANHKEHKIFGYFNFRLAAFFVNDPEIIKKICIKDFEHFPNHRPFMQSNDEPMVNSMLSLMKDQRWKDMRMTLTPVFTAAKMRSMFSLMNECFDESIQFLKSQSINGAPFDKEMKECFTRLSNDIIASTAFGLKINSYEDRDNEFYNIGQSITNFRGAQMFRFFLATTFPRLMEILKIKIFDEEKCDYFLRLVVDAMQQRQEKNIVRPDMIQLLIEAKKSSEQEWQDHELVAQCFIFFFAAFENNANLICVTLHELMENPDVQQRLYEEVCDMNKDLNGGHLTYDAVGKMTYLDMVVSESLRKWPLAGATDRVCSKDYKLYDDEGNFIFEFKEGDNIFIPIAGFHHDERYFEDHETFNPERFSEENKKNIQPFTYIPFGVGPRNCIGNRYALMQGKAMLYYMLLNFKFERSTRTFKNMLDDVRGFQMAPDSGFWLKLVPRK